MLKIDPRTALAFLHDVAAAAVAWWMAFILRFNFEIPSGYTDLMHETLSWVVPIQAALFWLFGLYRGIWRYASLPDLKRIMVTVTISVLVLSALFLMLQTIVPRSVLIIDPLLLVMIMGGSRFTYRVWKERRLDTMT